MGVKWYVLHVETGSEILVRDTLNRIVTIKAVVPRQEKVERRQGKKIVVVRTIFQGYVFVKADLTPDIYYRIRSTPRVYKFLGSNRPEPIPEEELHFILGFLGRDEIIGISDAMMEGRSIRVTNGPLLGMEGYIVKVNKRKGRVKARFGILGHTKSVELSVNFVEASK